MSSKMYTGDRLPRMQNGGAVPFVGILVLVGGLLVQGAQPPLGVAPVKVPKGGFGIDGDPMSDSSEGGVGDWIGSAESALDGGAVLDASGLPFYPLMTHHVTEAAVEGRGDSIFVGGTKWSDDPNTWQWKIADPSTKTDLRDVWVHVATSPDRHLWAVVSTGRAAAAGDSHLDIEFLQNRLEQREDGTFFSFGPDGGRTVNDLLVAFDFAQGGEVPEFSVWRWQSVGNGQFSYVDISSGMVPGRMYAAVNRDSVTLPRGATEAITFSPNAFAEAAVDLTTLIAQVDPCFAPSIATLLVKSKVSVPLSAPMKDFISPIQLQLPLPVAVAGPDQRAFAQLGGTGFSLQAAAIADQYPVSSITWNVVEGNALIESPSSLNTMVQVFSANATLRLTVTLESGCVFSDELTLTAIPLRLEIFDEGDGQTYLRWPSINSDYQLEATESLSSPNWQAFSAAIEERDGYFYASVAFDQNQMFFRLSDGQVVLIGSH